MLYNGSTRRTAIWYLNNNIFVSGAFGPDTSGALEPCGIADFDGDGNEAYLLFNSGSHQTGIWYLSGSKFLRGAYGPSIPSGWTLVATADFNSDGHPEYLVYNARDSSNRDLVPQR